MNDLLRSKFKGPLQRIRRVTLAYTFLIDADSPRPAKQANCLRSGQPYCSPYPRNHAFTTACQVNRKRTKKRADPVMKMCICRSMNHVIYLSENYISIRHRNEIIITWEMTYYQNTHINPIVIIPNNLLQVCVKILPI